MSIAPLLLFAIIGGLTVFAWQNWTPAIALTFLGLQTPALPLSLWIVLAIVAGILTALVINALFITSNYLAIRDSRFRRSPTPPRSRPFEASRPSGAAPAEPTGSRSQEPDDPDSRSDSWFYQAPRSQPPRSPAPSSASKRYETPTRASDYQRPAEADLDDWERPMREDWGDEAPENSRDRRAPSPASPPSSTYSYSQRQPRESDRGRSDSVVDADYRVIVPPYRPIDAPPPTSEPEESAEDWFEDDRDATDRR